MATATFDISVDQVEKITDYLGYQVEIDDKPNPETRKAFLYGKVEDYLKNCYKAEKAKDGEVARVAALEEAEIELETLEVKE